jgi:hypothetical protein
MTLTSLLARTLSLIGHKKRSAYTGLPPFEWRR